MKRFWLIFAQAFTLICALAYFFDAPRPGWLPQGFSRAKTAVIHEAASPGLLASPANAPALGFRTAAQKALPAVVHIFTSQQVKSRHHPLFDDPVFRHFFGDGLDDAPRRESGLGSGVIVSANGYILTNYHVVEAADQIEVLLSDGRKFPARVVGSDPETDLAVLDIEADQLPAITFGRMEDVGVGDVVLAIGNPFGVGQTVTMGIVSALGRSHLGINTFENFIQTDAAINPGNSGGALIDAAGNLIGINTAIYSRSGGSLGIGFAIPVSLTRQVMDAILRSGQVVRGWIGVEAQEITPELAESFGLPETQGALIAGVVRGSPADKAGILPGDVLIAVGGHPINDPQGMLDQIAGQTPGTTVPLTILRGQERRELTVDIAKRPPLTRQELPEE
ncbi:MAG: Do family serine endopeptidase [Zoogloeaceae bacterium]|jgi:Do/DeqQ family serine protease|nr:Do family serine endopeptidase [Zoogloeaceae bacterium]